MRTPKVYLETTLFNGYRAVEIDNPMEVIENENA